MNTNLEIGSKNIDHLGIISGICDKIQLVETIDSIIPKSPNMQLSVGKRIKAMIINGLGFTGRPLYIAEDFFNTKPTELLLGENVTADNLNDDSLGRGLDALYEANAEFVFSKIAAKAIEIYKIIVKSAHYDTTSVSLDGNYENESGVQIVKFGYSKDMRSDLKQIIFGSLACGNEGIPLIAKILPGNTSDSAHFKETLKTLKDNAFAQNPDFRLVFDAAGYNEETIQSLHGTKWISRVPATIEEAQQLKKSLELTLFTKVENGYSIYETKSNYGGVEQRWIVVHSEKALIREKRTVGRTVMKENEEVTKQIKKLCKKKFACSKDAEVAARELEKTLKFHGLNIVAMKEKKCFLSKGKPKPDAPFTLQFSPEITLLKDDARIAQVVKSKSIFIVATNELDTEKLSGEAVLKEYKAQYKAERGFRFLKNPLCMAKSVYLKKQSRIIALGVVMFLCLLVYAIAEQALRKALVENNATVLSQVRKPVQNPTMRWVFQKMEDVTVLQYTIAGRIITIIANLTEELKKIITLLGPECMSKYLLPT
jgi:transposase